MKSILDCFHRFSQTERRVGCWKRFADAQNDNQTPSRQRIRGSRLLSRLVQTVRHHSSSFLTCFLSSPLGTRTSVRESIRVISWWRHQSRPPFTEQSRRAVRIESPLQDTKTNIERSEWPWFTTISTKILANFVPRILVTRNLVPALGDPVLGKQVDVELSRAKPEASSEDCNAANNGLDAQGRDVLEGSGSGFSGVADGHDRDGHGSNGKGVVAGVCVRLQKKRQGEKTVDRSRGRREVHEERKCLHCLHSQDTLSCTQ